MGVDACRQWWTAWRLARSVSDSRPSSSESPPTLLSRDWPSVLFSNQEKKMKRVLVSALATVAILASAAASAMQIMSAAPPDWERPLASDVLSGQGRTIVVTATGDSGPGTLRQALLDARSGDTVTFDPSMFPPSAPVAIPLRSGLPPVNQSATLRKSGFWLPALRCRIGRNPCWRRTQQSAPGHGSSPNAVAARQSPLHSRL